MSHSNHDSTDTPKVRLSFYVILLLLPIILLVLVELGLRGVGFGRVIPLFVSENSPGGYLQPNPKIIHRYFANEQFAPKVSPDTVFFNKEKGPDTFRIFIQGGSSAAGFPYGRWGSLQGMLDQRFKRLFPERKIEVINTAMSAVNTYTLLDFTDEIIAEKPDLVMIYAGHNEYLGVMGAGSAFAAKGGRAATLLYLKLKELRIYQLLEQVFYAVFAPDIEADNDNRTLMSRVAKGKEIPLDSPLYKLGVEQFSGNLGDILRKYQSAGIPVMVGTLASNEKNQPPFSSINDIDWEGYTKGLNSADIPQQLTALESVSADERTAEQWYKLGLLYYRGQQFEKSKAAFITAKDHDQLRFRAPSVFNQVIAEQAKKYDAVVVDSEQYLREDSQDGILGFDHMLEHLHPTARGYFLLGEAFVDGFVQNREVFGFNAPISVEYPREKAWEETPITPVAKRFADFKIAALTGDYPFSRVKKPLPKIDTTTFEGKMALERAKGAAWLPIQQKLLRHYQTNKQIKEAARIAANLSDAFIDNHHAPFAAARLYSSIKDYPIAVYYYRRAIERAPTNVQYHLGLAHNLFLLERIDESLALLERVLELDPGNGNATFFHERLTHIKAEKQSP